MKYWSVSSVQHSQTYLPIYQSQAWLTCLSTIEKPCWSNCCFLLLFSSLLLNCIMHIGFFLWGWLKGNLFQETDNSFFFLAAQNKASAIYDLQRNRSNLESLFCYDKSVPEENIGKPSGLDLEKKDVGGNPPCSSCEAKGAVLCATCAGSGLYVDSILESQGIIVKVRCLGKLAWQAHSVRQLLPCYTVGFGYTCWHPNWCRLWRNWEHHVLQVWRPWAYLNDKKLGHCSVSAARQYNPASILPELRWWVFGLMVTSSIKRVTILPENFPCADLAAVTASKHALEAIEPHPPFCFLFPSFHA
jgi:hypothetical protein